MSAPEIRSPLAATGRGHRLDAFLHDALLEVFLAAERQWWLKRADEFLAARPTPGDFTGEATRAELSAQWRRLTEIARACRARAEVSPVEDLREDVANVLREVAA